MSPRCSVLCVPPPGCLLGEVNRLVRDRGWCWTNREMFCCSDETISKDFPMWKDVCEFSLCWKRRQRDLTETLHLSPSILRHTHMYTHPESSFTPLSSYRTKAFKHPGEAVNHLSLHLWNSWADMATFHKSQTVSLCVEVFMHLCVY